MYKVLGGYKSRTFRVLWLLEELGLEYHHDAVLPKDEAITSIYPAGKIPVLLDGDEVLTDSVAIMTYLADKHGKFVPNAGTIERAKLDGMVHKINDEVDALLWMAARHSFILPEEHRVAEVKPSLKWEFARNMDRIADNLGDKEFLMGDEFTIADILLTHCGGWAITAKFPKTDKPNFKDYFRRMVSRPAYQKARNEG